VQNTLAMHYNPCRMRLGMGIRVEIEMEMSRYRLRELKNAAMKFK